MAQATAIVAPEPVTRSQSRSSGTRRKRSLGMNGSLRRRWFFVVILSAVSAVSAVGIAPVTPASADAGEARLLVTDYSSVRLLSPTGRGHRVLATSEYVSEADYGPGGRQIAYATVTGPVVHQTQLRVVQGDGSRDRALLTLPWSMIFSVEWSPDGRWIAFRAVHGTSCWGCPPPWLLHVFSPADRTHFVLGPADEIDWSPDSRRIALAHAGAIHVVDVIAGAIPRRITSSEVVAHSPTWSPDGRLVAFLRGSPLDETPRVWVIRPDGSGARALAASTWSEVSWSPDSRSIATIETAYSEGSIDGVGTLTISPTDGSEGRALRLPAGWSGEPSWSPGGGSIAYIHQPAPRAQNDWNSVRLIRPDGSDDREIHRTGATGSDVPRVKGPLRWN